MNKLGDYLALLDRVARVYDTLPKKAAVLAVNFSKERFREQNWHDTTKQPWPMRKANKRKRDTRGILIDSGRLKRSIRVITATSSKIVIGTDVPYAQVHNEGATINTTANVPAHTRSKHTRKRNGRRQIVAAHKVKAHTRKMNFTMPKRQFLGQSNELERQIVDFFTNELSRAIAIRN